jgi:hypothetical protein
MSACHPPGSNAEGEAPVNHETSLRMKNTKI